MTDAQRQRDLRILTDRLARERRQRTTNYLMAAEERRSGLDRRDPVGRSRDNNNVGIWIARFHAARNA